MEILKHVTYSMSALAAVYLVIINLVAFALYYIDKQKAKRNKWRIKESVLLGVGFFGGAVGALAAMKLFRHKTQHFYFYVVNVLGLIVFAGLVFVSSRLLMPV